MLGAMCLVPRGPRRCPGWGPPAALRQANPSKSAHARLPALGDAVPSRSLGREETTPLSCYIQTQRQNKTERGEKRGPVTPRRAVAIPCDLLRCGFADPMSQGSVSQSPRHHPHLAVRCPRWDTVPGAALMATTASRRHPLPLPCSPGWLLPKTSPGGVKLSPKHNHDLMVSCKGRAHGEASPLNHAWGVYGLNPKSPEA